MSTGYVLTVVHHRGLRLPEWLGLSGDLRN